MKKLIVITILLVTIFSFDVTSQEKYGKTINLGMDIGGYYGYYDYKGRSLPVLHFVYEFDVAKNFTLTPFVNFYSYNNTYYWKGNKNYPGGYYVYRETVIPIGAKGTYYFDALLGANSNWDFYLAGSLGFAIVNSRWDEGYYGDKNYYRNGNPLFFDIHLGTEYHLNNSFGVFLDLSSGVSTLGLAIHL